MAVSHRFNPSGRTVVSKFLSRWEGGGFIPEFFLFQFLSWCSFSVLCFSAPLLLLPEVCGSGVRVDKGARKSSELWAEDQVIFGREKLL